MSSINGLLVKNKFELFANKITTDELDLENLNKGSILVSDGAKFTELPITLDGLVLTSNSTQPNGVEWAPGGGGGGGDVLGPNLSVNDNITVFNGTTGKIIKDSGISVASFVNGPVVAVDSNIAVYDGITGKLLKDGGVSVTSFGDVNGPAVAVDSNIALFDGVTGKLVKDSGFTTRQAWQDAADALQIVKIGNSSSATFFGDTITGRGASSLGAAGTQHTAFGYFAKSLGGTSLACGSLSTAAGSSAVALGFQTNAAREGDICIGLDCTTVGNTGFRNVVIGDTAKCIGGGQSIAIGDRAETSGVEGISVGTNISNTHDNSICFGTNANSDISHRFSINNQGVTATPPTKALLADWHNIRINNVNKFVPLFSSAGVLALPSYAEMYENANVLVTTIVTQSVFVKANLLGTLSGITTSDWTIAADNRMTYTSSSPRNFKLDSTITGINSGTGNITVCGVIYKNGVIVSKTTAGVRFTSNREGSISCTGILSFALNDYIELWVSNETNTNNIEILDININLIAID